MRKAFAHTAAYDTAIAATLLQTEWTAIACDARDACDDADCRPTLELADRSSSRSEGPRSALRREPAPEGRVVRGRRPRSGRASARRRSCRARSCRSRTCSTSTRPRASCSSSASRRRSVIKHTNPCGAATGASRGRRLRARARRRQPRRLRRHRGAQPADRRRRPPRRSSSTFIEAVIAPSVDDAARAILAKQAQHARGRRRTSTRMPAPATLEIRSILGAMLVQERDRRGRGATSRGARTSLPDGLRVVTKRQPTAEEWEALRFAWRVCAHVKSNTVIFTDAQRTLAIGAGQMSRVDAVNVAVMKAQARGRRSQDRSPRPTRSSRFATASTPWRPPAPRRSCSPAARCATPR